MSDRWLQAFRSDPEAAVSALFTGRAGVGFDMRLDVPELLYQWFPPDLAEERGRLDDALFSWLRNMRDDYASSVQRLGFPVYGKRIGDALIALQLLDLPRARDAIRSDLDAWLRWLSPLRLAPERDPALECYRLLTHGQPDAGHAAMWLRLATDGRPEYLTVALAGLQRLPNDGNARKNQMLMLQALLRHAATVHHDVNAARRFFDRHFAALRGFAALPGFFPRSPKHWNRVLEDALDSSSNPAQAQMTKDLADDLRERSLSKQPRSSSRPAHSSLPTKEEMTGLAKDIDKLAQSSETLASRLFSLLERYHAHALATSDSHFFARTLSNLGNKLLEHHRLGMDDLARFGVMIERALVWEPANPYCWTLWAKWFEVQGEEEAQEAVLRETLRMFPSNAPAQVELALLLITRDEECWDEAEQYLRRTIDLDPQNEHAHVVIAHLLALRGRLGDAKKTLADFLDQHPDNQRARQFLNDLQAGTHTNTATPFEDSPSNRRQAQVDSDYSPTTATNGALQEVLRRGRLAGEFSRALAGRTNAVQTIKQERLVGDALAGFYSQWLRLEDTPMCPPHAWAWAACQHWQESATADWRELAKRFPEAASETDFLRVLARPDPSDVTGWQDRHYSGNGAAPRPVDALMRERKELLVATDLDDNVREELACEVMACLAAKVPEFAASSHDGGLASL